MSDGEILRLLAAEADRRIPVIVDGGEQAIAGSASTETIESMRAEAHGLKGAAAVVGQVRLSEVAAALERRLIAAGEAGNLARADAELIVRAARAFREGAHAAASGEGEPEQLADALSDLQRQPRGSREAD